MLTEVERRIAETIEARLHSYLALLRETVRIPSATENHDGIRAVGAIYRRELERLGFSCDWLVPPVPTAGHLIAHRGEGKHVLLIGHLDTVIDGGWFDVDGEIARGAGASDMKGGNTVIVGALDALASEGVLDGCAVTVILAGDEEQPPRPFALSRQFMIDEARDCVAALAFESAHEGTGTVARRGVTTWDLDVEGVTGHSMNIFGDIIGSGAVLEAARVLDGFRRALDEEYLTFNPALVVGGTECSLDEVTASGVASGKANVVPAAVRVRGDLRFISAEQRDRAIARMNEIAAQSLPRTSSSLRFREGFPAMFPSEGNHRLLAQLDAASRDLGLGGITAFDPALRGAGDIAFVSDLAPSLDGLGPLGGREHSADEFVRLDSFAPQMKRAALLISRLVQA